MAQLPPLDNTYVSPVVACRILDLNHRSPPGSGPFTSAWSFLQCKLDHPLDLFLSQFTYFRTGYTEVNRQNAHRLFSLTRRLHSIMFPGLLLFSALQQEGWSCHQGPRTSQ